MTNKNNRIQFGGTPEYETYDAEVASGETVTPGHLLEVTAVDDDGTLTVKPHSADGEAPQVPLFADIVPYSGDQEDDSVDPVDDDYAAGDYVKVIGANRYNRVNAVLAAGADLVDSGDATVTDYTGLTSAGDGTLRTTATTSGTTFCHGREAVDNSGASAGEVARLIVEVQ